MEWLVCDCRHEASFVGFHSNLAIDKPEAVPDDLSQFVQKAFTKWRPIPKLDAHVAKGKRWIVAPFGDGKPGTAVFAFQKTRASVSIPLDLRMRVSILLFGAEAAAAGSPRVEVEAPPAPTCADLRELLGARCPALRPFLGAARFAVNSEFAGPSTVIQAADEVALIGMVSGG